jgi:hypothetical protein
MESEQTGDAASVPALAAPALKLMFNKGGLSNMSQFIAFLSFFHSILYEFKSEKIMRNTCPNP